MRPGAQFVINPPPSEFRSAWRLEQERRRAEEAARTRVAVRPVEAAPKVAKRKRCAGVTWGPGVGWVGPAKVLPQPLRVCAEAGCGRLLRSNNRSGYCAAMHADKHLSRARRGYVGLCCRVCGVRIGPRNTFALCAEHGREERRLRDVELAKAWQQRQLARGGCRVCGQPRAAGSRSVCAAHLEQMRRNDARYRAAKAKVPA